MKRFKEWIWPVVAGWCIGVWTLQGVISFADKRQQTFDKDYELVAHEPYTISSSSTFRWVPKGDKAVLGFLKHVPPAIRPAVSNQFMTFRSMGLSNEEAWIKASQSSITVSNFLVRPVVDIEDWVNP